MTINTIIRMVMKQQSMSQKELADTLGMKQQTINEKLKASGITIPNAVKMLDVLGYDLIAQPRTDTALADGAYRISLEDEPAEETPITVLSDGSIKVAEASKKLNAIGYKMVVVPMESDEGEGYTIVLQDEGNITSRTSAGRAAKAADGGYSGGKAPFGYKVINGMLVINEDESPAVRRIFELRDAGVVMVDIATALNNEGYKTRNGGPWALATIRNILNNRKTYEGYYHYGKTGEWVKGQHEAILKDG